MGIDIKHRIKSTDENAMPDRELLLAAREQALQLREADIAIKEKALREAVRIQEMLFSHLARLRQANEHLVISTIESQVLMDEIQKAKDQLSHMAHHDFLTDLPNRVLFMERLVQAISLARRHSNKLAVLFIDLDRFKTINDSLGHAVGDKLLQAVAQRLMASIRSTDTVSRQGGDEFVILLSEVEDDKGVADFASDSCRAISAPYVVGEHDLHIGATIGISMFPGDGDDADSLIQHADVAMYNAKNDGGNRYHFYRAAMNARAIERQKIEGELHHALEHQEFELYYQAQIELQTGNVTGVEALVRWQHPARGLLLPGLFVPIAEECGAIVPIGRWVLREACRQTKAWQDAGLELQGVAVNISAVELAGDHFSDHVRAVLHDTRLDARHLELELTESVLMKNVEASMPKLQELKSMGIKIAIDDFGTGYSSLSYLKQFPVDTLKIDQSFVAGIVANSENDILVDAVIGLGKSLQYTVVAEGIETPEQLAFLCSHQCVIGQGFYLSRPMIAEEFSTFLKFGLPADLCHHNKSLH